MFSTKGRFDKIKVGFDMQIVPDIPNYNLSGTNWLKVEHHPVVFHLLWLNSNFITLKIFRTEPIYSIIWHGYVICVGTMFQTTQYISINHIQESVWIYFWSFNKEIGQKRRNEHECPISSAIFLASPVHFFLFLPTDQQSVPKKLPDRPIFRWI